MGAIQVSGGFATPQDTFPSPRVGDGEPDKEGWTNLRPRLAGTENLTWEGPKGEEPDMGT